MSDSGSDLLARACTIAQQVGQAFVDRVVATNFVSGSAFPESDLKWSKDLHLECFRLIIMMEGPSATSWEYRQAFVKIACWQHGAPAGTDQTAEELSEMVAKGKAAHAAGPDAARAYLKTLAEWDRVSEYLRISMAVDREYRLVESASLGWAHQHGDQAITNDVCGRIVALFDAEMKPPLP